MYLVPLTFFIAPLVVTEDEEHEALACFSNETCTPVSLQCDTEAPRGADQCGKERYSGCTGRFDLRRPASCTPRQAEVHPNQPGRNLYKSCGCSGK